MSSYFRRILANQIVASLKRNNNFNADSLEKVQGALAKSLVLNKVAKKTKPGQLCQFVLPWKPNNENRFGTSLSAISDSLKDPGGQDPYDLKGELREEKTDTLHLILSPEYFGKELIRYILQHGDNYGYQGEPQIRGDSSGQAETVIVEYSSPNIAKPFHVGHLRSTIIGNFLANLYEKLGYHVIRLNYLGDWGTQFGLLAVGFQRYGNLDELDRNAMEHLFNVYVQVNQDLIMEENSTAEKENGTHHQAREVFRKMEEGDKELLELWKKFRHFSIQELTKVYKRLGVEFTEYHGESMYRDESEQLVDRLKQEGLLEVREDGRRCVKVDTISSPMDNVVIQKSDGTSLYITRDVAALLDRYQKYDFSKIHYVVEKGQYNHFRHLLGMMRLLEPWSDRLDDDLHVMFGRVAGMQTRKGDVVFLKDVLDEAQSRMIQTMSAKESTKVSEDISEVADILGVSAVIVQDLSHKRMKDYAFSWQRAINLNADSGVFLQYTYARLCNLKENCGVTLKDDFNPKHLVNHEAQLLLLHLAGYEDVVENSLRTLEPFHVVLYLFQLCHLVNGCYKVMAVKGEEEEVAQARLQLFHVSRITLGNGMKLLGLTPLQKM